MKYVRDEANNLYEALDKAQTLAQITSAVNTEKTRAMAAEAEEKARAMEAEAAEQTALNNKVDKVQGKALSTNDFTDHHKEIVEQLETGSVTGVKGEKESAYRTGQVNLTADNVGAAKAKDAHTNLLNPTLTTRTYNGVTCTANGDGTFTLNGTASGGTANFMIHELGHGLKLDKGQTLRITGCPSEGNENVCILLEAENGTAYVKRFARDIGQGATVTISNEDAAAYTVRVTLHVQNGFTANNFIFKPMLTTDLNATYDEFVQFSGEGELNENVADIYKDLKAVANLIYPVGSIYMSVNAVNPATLFGGTWEQIKDKFLLSAGNTYANGSTGGEATHALTVEELPAHNHGLNNHTHSIPALSGSTNETGAHTHKSDWPNFAKNAWFQENGQMVYVGSWTQTGGTSSNGNHKHTVTTNASTTGGNSGNTTNTGSGTAHNNMPPYLVVNVWKRTA